MDQRQRNLAINCQLDESRRLTVEKNRSILVPIVETILLCARQNIALRGHRNESGTISSDGLDPEENDGNFRALLRFRIRGGDAELKSHVQSTKANATYQSPDIQNALIVAAGDLVKETVVSRIKSAKFWAIVADETKDRHHREQLAVIARYVKMDSLRKWHCHEEPFAIVDIFALIKDLQPSKDDERCLSGNAIGEALLHIVKCLQLDLTKCIGQGYDGASSMAGQRAGAAARFEVEAPDAHYYHCAMHCLNLSSAKAITVQSIRQAQDVIKDITSCFRSSAKRTDLLKSCIHDEEDTRISKTQLVTLCTTRFVKRHTSVVCLRSLLKYVMAALQRMSASGDCHLMRARRLSYS